MRVIDCFPFLNELEVLELRLAVLSEIADWFVIVEANRTHTGNPKEYVFAQNRGRFASYLDRIYYVQVDDLPLASAEDLWVAENYQRNAIQRALHLGQPGDIILVSDVDEIPNPQTVKEHVHTDRWLVLKQHLYYYYVNCRVTRNWGGTVMAPFGSFKTPQDLRNCAKRRSVGDINNGGWHYSYLVGNDPEKVVYKAANIVDHYTGYNLGSPEDIAQRIEEHTDPYGRKRWYHRMRIVDIRPTMPAAMPAFIHKYPWLYYGTGADLQ